MSNLELVIALAVAALPLTVDRLALLIALRDTEPADRPEIIRAMNERSIIPGTRVKGFIPTQPPQPQRTGRSRPRPRRRKPDHVSHAVSGRADSGQ